MLKNSIDNWKSNIAQRKIFGYSFWEQIKNKFTQSVRNCPFLLYKLEWKLKFYLIEKNVKLEIQNVSVRNFVWFEVSNAKWYRCLLLLFVGPTTSQLNQIHLNSQGYTSIVRIIKILTQLQRCASKWCRNRLRHYRFKCQTK